MSLVCDNDLSALVINGKPPVEALQDAKINIIQEFVEASGSAGLTAAVNARKEYYLCRTHILGLGIAIQALHSDCRDEALAYLRSHGITPSTHDDPDAVSRLIRQINGKIDIKKINMERAIKRVEAAAGDNKPPSRQDFYQQMAILSAHYKFDIDTSITLAKYAAYIKMFKKSVKNEQNRK